MISILNIPLFSSATEYDTFIDALKTEIENTTTLKLKGEEEEIDKIIEKMLEALYYNDHSNFEITHTQFLTKLEAEQRPVFDAHCLSTLLMLKKCTPEILEVILNSDSGTDLIQQTFPIDKHSVMESIVTFNQGKLFDIIINHPKTCQLFISPKERPDLQDSTMPTYDQPYLSHDGRLMDIFNIIIRDIHLTRQETSRYLQTIVLFQEHLNTLLGDRKNVTVIDLTNFQHLCYLSKNKASEIKMIKMIAEIEAQDAAMAAIAYAPAPAEYAVEYADARMRMRMRMR